MVNDVCVLSNPHRTSEVEGSVEHELWDHARIQVNQGKTLWNRSGVKPIATICSLSQKVNPTACGGETTRCRCSNRVSRFWELLWSIPFSRRPSFLRKLQSTQLFLRGSLAVCLANVLVFLYREQITFFALFTLNRTSILRCVTTQESDGAWNSYCTTHRATKCGKWPLCSSLFGLSSPDSPGIRWQAFASTLKEAFLFRSLPGWGN